MPLEARNRDVGCTLPFEADFVINPEGSPRAWFDKATGVARFVIAVCDPEDGGGYIYVEDDQVVIDRFFDGSNRTVATKEDQLYQVIVPGGLFMTKIADINGEESILTVQHRIEGSNFMQSFN